MTTGDDKTNGVTRGVFSRLRSDVRANTLAIMAAALIPIAAIAGSAVDMARMHVVKVRLQQACDAGTLAGRKFLPNGTASNVVLLTGGSPNTPNASTTADANGRTLFDDGTQAQKYFANNLETSWLSAGWFTAGTDTFDVKTVADAQGVTQVGGTASAVVPMTLMQMFNFNAQKITVTCQASTSTPDTDVMFVLDTTGSMGCAVTRDESSCDGTWVPNNQGTYTKSDGTTGYYVKEETSGGANVSRIDALRQAVNNFYQTVATKKDPSTNVRYGFVPYTSTVNVGTLLYGLSPSYLVSSWSYQSRVPTSDYVVKTVSTKVVSATSQAACNANYSRTPATRVNASTGDANAGYPNGGTATAIDPVWTVSQQGATTCTLDTDQIGPVWTYQAAVKYDVSNYLKGGSMTDPSRVDGSTTTWNGCIEERDTTAGATTFDPTNLPPDLDPDLQPTSDSTRWRPLWADVEYARQLYNYTGNPGSVTYQGDLLNYNDSGLAQGGSMSCPAQATALFLPNNLNSGATTISNYVAGLKAIGGTYHDIGMIWGTRMLSPTGIWASNNAWPSGRAAPRRMIVFVTDGVMSPGSQIYGGYGTEYVDRRVTGAYYGSTTDPSAGKNNDGTCTNTAANCYAYTHTFHEGRFLAECARAKASPLNFDVWVVEVAQASSPALTQCASRPTQVLVGQTTAQLNSAFQQIAAQVAMLRVTQ